MSRGFESHTLRWKRALVTKTTRPARRGRRTVARHGELSSPHPFSLFLKVIGVIVAVVLAAGAGIAAYAAYDITASFAEGAVDLEDQGPVPPDIGAIESEVDLFIAGTDACEPEYAQFFGARCTGADAGGELNDVNLLVHISAEPRRVTVVSFPRDLMVPIPSCTRADGSQTSAMSKQMINSAYMYGGLSCVVKTVSQLAGRPIPFAAKVTWGGVIEITNAIGGVEVCIGNGGIRDRYTGIDWPAGPRTISGLEALQFLRTRHGLENGSDLARISNQQQYMSRLARKVLSSETLSDVPTVLRLANTIADNVEPSDTLADPVRMGQLALALKDVPFEDFVFVQYPTLEDPDDSDRVVPNLDAAEPMWAALAAGRSLEITGEASNHGGAVGGADAPTPASSASPTGSPPGSPTPTDRETLSPSISGIDLNQETCTGARR